MMLLLKKQNNLHPFKILNMHYFKYIQKQAPLSKRYWPHAAGIFKNEFSYKYVQIHEFATCWQKE
jgi:hypothetical protein